MRFTFSRNNVNVLDYSADCFELLRIEKHFSSYRGHNYMGNDLKETKIASS